MGWHEHIDDRLAEFSARQHQPLDLTLNNSLHKALLGVEESSNADPVTLRVMQAIADTAIDPMVVELAHTKNPYLNQLGWLRLRDHSDYSALRRASDHSALTRVAAYYSSAEVPESSMIGNALFCAARLMECAYSLVYQQPAREPSPADMLRVVSLFAVTSHVHAQECGPERNRVAIESLAQLITDITTTG